MKEDHIQPIVLPTGYAGSGLRVYRDSDIAAEAVPALVSSGIKESPASGGGARRGRPRIPENRRKMYAKQSTYRLAPESKAQLQVIINVLKTSSEVAALQIAVNYLFEHLGELAPLTATSSHLSKLFDEELKAAQRG